MWDLASGHCLGVYSRSGPFHSTALHGAGNVIRAGTATGEGLFLELHRGPSGPAILTAANFQQARCPVCGQEFAPPPAVVTALRGADAAGLLSHCPHCQHTLQFNPFFATADDYAEVLRRGLEQSRREKGDMETLAHLAALAAHLEHKGQPEAARPFAEEHARLTAKIAASVRSEPKLTE